MILVQGLVLDLITCHSQILRTIGPKSKPLLSVRTQLVPQQRKMCGDLHPSGQYQTTAKVKQASSNRWEGIWVLVPNIFHSPLMSLSRFLSHVITQTKGELQMCPQIDRYLSVIYLCLGRETQVISRQPASLAQHPFVFSESNFPTAVKFLPLPNTTSPNIVGSSFIQCKPPKLH